MPAAQFKFKSQLAAAASDGRPGPRHRDGDRCRFDRACLCQRGLGLPGRAADHRRRMSESSRSLRGCRWPGLELSCAAGPAAWGPGSGVAAALVTFCLRRRMSLWGCSSIRTMTCRPRFSQLTHVQARRLRLPLSRPPPPGRRRAAASRGGAGASVAVADGGNSSK